MATSSNYSEHVGGQLNGELLGAMRTVAEIRKRYPCVTQ